MALFRKQSQQTSASVEEGRWRLVSNRIGPTESRIVTTPVYAVAGPQRVGGHAFLTDQRLLIGITEAPFGSDSAPMVLDAPIKAITQLIMSDDGWLVTVNPDSSGNESSNVLDLYPSPISQALVRQLRELWVQSTDGEPEGNWELWIGQGAAQLSRSATAWARGG